MKTDATHAKKLNALIKAARKKANFEEPVAMAPVAQLVMAYLEWNATTRQAEKAYDRLMAETIDFNDVRVSHRKVLLDIIGEDYPLGEDRLARLRASLQDIFLREHGMSMDTIAGKSKKEIKLYLDTLGGIPQYVAAKVLLASFGGHAIPVDKKLATLLIDEGAAPEGASVDDIASFLERQVKAADGAEVHFALKTWADTKRRKIEPFAATPIVPPAPVEEAAPPPKKKTAKKSTGTKKTATGKKTTKKKTAKKKIVRKK